MMCELIPNWHHFQTSFFSPMPLLGRFKHTFRLDVADCDGRVRYIEHVHAKITLKYSRRGDIKITLVSPSGTRCAGLDYAVISIFTINCSCVLLPPRARDNNNSGFHEWPFLSVHHWGEDVRGVWLLTIENVGVDSNHGAPMYISLNIFFHFVNLQAPSTAGR
jgi:subtilisin-like proprotein convertase family protein